jgi:hypothetical protein
MFTYRWRTLVVPAAAVVLIAGSSVVAAQLEFSSASRDRGRATVEYRTDDIHIVASYNYSQRNHDSRWIMIQTGISTTSSTSIPRSAIAIRTPDGRDVPLATQREFGADPTRIHALLQNARAVVHDVTSYFVQRDRVEDMRLFRLPFDDVVHNSFVVDRDRVAVGPLFFASPTGAWERGTYALVVQHPEGTASLPIRLLE